MCSHLGVGCASCKTANFQTLKHTRLMNPLKRVLQGQWAAMQQQPGALAAGNGSRKRSTVLRIIAAAAAHSGAEEAKSLTIDLLKVC